MAASSKRVRAEDPTKVESEKRTKVTTDSLLNFLDKDTVQAFSKVVYFTEYYGVRRVSLQIKAVISKLSPFASSTEIRAALSDINPSMSYIETICAVCNMLVNDDQAECYPLIILSTAINRIINNVPEGLNAPTRAASNSDLILHSQITNILTDMLQLMCAVYSKDTKRRHANTLVKSLVDIMVYTECEDKSKIPMDLLNSIEPSNSISRFNNFTDSSLSNPHDTFTLDVRGAEVDVDLSNRTKDTHPDATLCIPHTALNTKDRDTVRAYQLYLWSRIRQIPGESNMRATALIVDELAMIHGDLKHITSRDELETQNCELKQRVTELENSEKNLKAEVANLAADIAQIRRKIVQDRFAPKQSASMLCEPNRLKTQLD
jgi:hypothetical protein